MNHDDRCLLLLLTAVIICSREKLHWVGIVLFIIAACFVVWLGAR